MFWVLSAVCLTSNVAACASNFDTASEKAGVVLNGVLMGLGPILGGLTWASKEDDENMALLGKGIVLIGIMQALILPPVFVFMASRWGL